MYISLFVYIRSNHNHPHVFGCQSYHHTSIEIISLVCTSRINLLSRRLGRIFYIDVYIPFGIYQVKPQSSPCFWLPVLPPYLIEIISLLCTSRINLLNQRLGRIFFVSFRPVGKRCRRVLEAAQLVYANKTREFITFEKLGLGKVWQIAKCVLQKDKSASFFRLMVHKCCVLHLSRSSCSLKSFLRILVLVSQVFVHLHSLVQLI